MKSTKYAPIGLFLLSSLPIANALDYEQQLLIENNGLDLTMLKGNVPNHNNLTNEKAQFSGSSSPSVELGSLDATMNEPGDPFANLLGDAEAPAASDSLDSLLSDTPEMPAQADAGLDSLLGGLDDPAPAAPSGLDSLDALLDAPATPEPAATPDPLGGLDSLLADAGSAPAPDAAAPGGLSGLDSILGDLGGGIEIEEVKIEGLGGTEEAMPEPKKETPKPQEVEKKKADPKKEKPAAAKKEAPKAMKKANKAVAKKQQRAQSDIAPLDRKLISSSGIQLGQLVKEVAQLGGWELETSKKFSAISNKKISLSFQGVPLKFILKWVSTQTGLQYKLNKETLSI